MSTEHTTPKTLDDYENDNTNPEKESVTENGFPEAVTEWFSGSSAGINTHTVETPHRELFVDRDTRSDDMDEVLSQMITDLAEGEIDEETWEQFEAWLQAQSDLTDYSVRNRFLIKMQYPEATFVSGYKQWQDKYNRHVRKGEKGIWIRYPQITGKKCPDCGTTPEYDPVAREKKPDTDPRDNHETCEFDTDPEDWSEGVVKYGFANVYDVSQTEGEPLPELTAAKGDADDLYDRVHEVATEKYGYEVEDGVVPTLGARGTSDSYGNITVRGYEETANKAKVLIHEMAHELLHPTEERSQTSRGEKEVEAESVAYIVGRYFGLDVSGSKLYIENWADDAESEIKSRMGRIKETSKELINAIEE